MRDPLLGGYEGFPVCLERFGLVRVARRRQRRHGWPGRGGSSSFLRRLRKGAFYWNKDTGETYLGVWGARNASRFRTSLRRAGFDVAIIHEIPPARLIYTCANGRRPMGESRSS